MTTGTQHDFLNRPSAISSTAFGASTLPEASESGDEGQVRRIQAKDEL